MIRFPGFLLMQASAAVSSLPPFFAFGGAIRRHADTPMHHGPATRTHARSTPRCRMRYILDGRTPPQPLSRCTEEFAEPEPAGPGRPESSSRIDRVGNRIPDAVCPAVRRNMLRNSAPGASEMVLERATEGLGALSEPSDGANFSEATAPRGSASPRPRTAMPPRIRSLVADGCMAGARAAPIGIAA